MNDFNKFMNAPYHSILPATDFNIIEEYKRIKDIGRVAKIFDIARSEVRSILKKTGIDIR